MHYKLRILGCGGSYGVPTIDRGWGLCDSNNFKNQRTRTSAFLEIKQNEHSESSHNILFDVGPDFRYQCLRENIKQINSLLITHYHSDHILGISELKAINNLMQTDIKAYSSKETLDILKQSYPYLFTGNSYYLKFDNEKQKNVLNYYSSALDFKEIGYYDKFLLKEGIEVTTTLQHHGRIDTVGYIINGKIGYATDFSNLPEKTLDMYKNLELLIFAIGTKDAPIVKNPAHMHLKQGLEVVKYLNPKQAILTHMSQQLDYEETLKQCPKNIIPAYDGLEISLDL